MIIITGGRGTGKSFVAEAIAKMDPERYIVCEVQNVDGARSAYKSTNHAGKESLFVCQDFVLTPADLGSVIPTYQIHITKSR